jgi:hypothetical protein
MEKISEISEALAKLDRILPTIREYAHNPEILKAEIDTLMKYLKKVRADDPLTLIQIGPLFNAVYEQLKTYSPESIVGSDISRTEVYDAQTEYQKVLKIYRSLNQVLLDAHAQNAAHLVAHFRKLPEAAISAEWRKNPEVLMPVYKQLVTSPELVRADKHWLLSADLTFPKNISKAPSQIIYKYCGYAPTGASKSLEDLYGVKTLKQLCTKHCMSVLVIYAENSVEYNYWPIMQRSDRFVSVNAAFIAKTATISYVPRKKNFEYSYELYEHPKAQGWIVLDSIVPDMYRALESTQPDAITHLLDFIKMPDMTSENGWAALSDEVLTKKAVTFQPVMEEFTAESKAAVDAATIKHDLKFKLMKYINKAKPKNIEALQVLLQSDESLQIFRNLILEKFNVYTQGELLTTFVCELQALMANFSREIGDLIVKRKIEDAEDIVTMALDTTITQSSNIYADVEYKAKLLAYAEYTI